MRTSLQIIARLFVVLLILLIAFSSCVNQVDNAMTRYTILKKSLDRGRKRLEFENSRMYAELNQKLEDPISHEKALIWFPRAKLIGQKCSDMKNFIAALRDTIKIISTNPSVIHALIYNQQKGAELFKKLGVLKSELLNIDARITDEFSVQINSIGTYSDNKREEIKEIANVYFKNTPEPIIEGLLSSLMNDITEVENRIIAFCNINSTVITCSWTSYSFIVTQNTKYLKTGEELEILAGVGGFSRSRKPEIKINHSDIIVADDGIATYKLKVKRAPGIFRVPVTISYLDDDGKRVIMDKQIECTIIE
jgi:hypothetical protein